MAAETQAPHIWIEAVQGGVTVSVSGDVDMAGAPLLRDALLRLLSQSEDILVVDLTYVDFIDSAGVSALIAGYKRAKKLGHSYRLVAPQPQVRNVLRITAVDTLIPVYASVADARRPTESPAGQ